MNCSFKSMSLGIRLKQRVGNPEVEGRNHQLLSQKGATLKTISQLSSKPQEHLFISFYFHENQSSHLYALCGFWEKPQCTVVSILSQTGCFHHGVIDLLPEDKPKLHHTIVYIIITLLESILCYQYIAWTQLQLYICRQSL